MKCPLCSSENSEGSSYCNGCGKAIDPKVAALESTLSRQLEERLQAALDTKFKDSKLLEIEVAEGVAKRLIEWSKICGICIALPLTILVVILGLFGLKNYNEFLAKIDETKKSAVQTAEQQLIDFKTANKVEFDKAKDELKGHLEETAKKELDEIHARGQELLSQVDSQVEKAPAIKDIRQKIKILDFPDIAEFAKTIEIVKFRKQVTDAVQALLQVAKNKSVTVDWDSLLEAAGGKRQAGRPANEKDFFYYINSSGIDQNEADAITREAQRQLSRISK